MANNTYEDENSGALFRVAAPNSAKHPTFSGVWRRAETPSMGHPARPPADDDLSC
jgi:hypothetical protein